MNQIYARRVSGSQNPNASCNFLKKRFFFSDCVAGWALRSSNDCALTFHHVWASGQIQIANYTLEHVDPSVQIIAFKVSLQQVHSALNEVFNIQVDTKAR